MNTELLQKEQDAIALLKLLDQRDPLYVCYSGGKDSDVLRILCDVGGVNYELHHNLTTVDAPETIYYMRQFVPEENIHKPERNMWKLIEDKLMPPTRIARYCCAELKERGGFGRKKVTGVRRSESINRRDNQGLFTIIGKPKTVQKAAEYVGAKYKLSKKGGVILNYDDAASRQLVENCYRTTSTLINPIIDWTDYDVWEYLYHYGCKANPLYQCGQKRVGCIGCPLGGYKSMKKEFARYPKYREAYVRAFDVMVERRKTDGMGINVYWRDGESVMRWWVGDNPQQITIEDWLKFREEESQTMSEYVW